MHFHSSKPNSNQYVVFNKEKVQNNASQLFLTQHKLLQEDFLQVYVKHSLGEDSLRVFFEQTNNLLQKQISSLFDEGFQCILKDYKQPHRTSSPSCSQSVSPRTVSPSKQVSKQSRKSSGLFRDVKMKSQSKHSNPQNVSFSQRHSVIPSNNYPEFKQPSSGYTGTRRTSSCRENLTLGIKDIPNTKIAELKSVQLQSFERVPSFETYTNSERGEDSFSDTEIYDRLPIYPKVYSSILSSTSSSDTFTSSSDSLTNYHQNLFELKLYRPEGEVLIPWRKNKPFHKQSLLSDSNEPKNGNKMVRNPGYDSSSFDEEDLTSRSRSSAT